MPGEDQHASLFCQRGKKSFMMMTPEGDCHRPQVYTEDQQNGRDR